MIKESLLQKKAGLEEQGFSSWLHEQLSYRSTFISRENAPEVAKTIRRMQRRERSYTSKTVAAGSRFCCFMKTPWFFLQLEVVKANNQTSHVSQKIKITFIYCMWNEEKAHQDGNFNMNHLVPMNNINQAEMKSYYKLLLLKQNVYALNCKTSASHCP